MEILEIKKLLKERKITYAKLSQLSGVPLSTLNDIFRGKTPSPRIDTIRAIETALDISSPTAWTPDELSQNITSTRRVEITPEEDDLLYLYRRIQRELGDAGTKTFKEMGELLLQIKKAP